MADNNSGVILNNLKVVVPDLKSLPLASEIKQLDKTATRVIDQSPGLMLNASIGILVIVFGWMFSSWMASKMTRLLNKVRVEETLASFLASTSRFALFFFLFITGIGIIGVSSTSIAAVLGAIGLAVGFSMRGTLANIAGGVMLIVHRPMKVGDYVENTFGGVTVRGTVKRIGLFSTEVNTWEFVRVFIPNALLWENVLQNHSYNRMHMTRGTFILGYDADARGAFQVVKDALILHPLVLKTPEPVVAVESMDEKGVICYVEVWTRSEDRRAMKDQLMLPVLEALKNNGFSLPKPAEGVQPTPETTDKHVDVSGSKSAKAEKPGAESVKVSDKTVGKA